MNVTHLFATPFWRSDLADDALLADLAHSCRVIATDDGAGRRWSRENRYPGYTSYASLDDLPKRDPAFAALARILVRHAARFAEIAHMDLGGGKPKLDSIWVNILKQGGGHSGHIHPHSIISGTIYVEVPEGGAPLRLEDPRLPLMMAAPTRRADAPAEAQPFVLMQPAAGQIFLWESWLRHEVVAGHGKGERVSISFNFS